MTDASQKRRVRSIQVARLFAAVVFLWWALAGMYVMLAVGGVISVNEPIPDSLMGQVVIFSFGLVLSTLGISGLEAVIPHE